MSYTADFLYEAFKKLSDGESKKDIEEAIEMLKQDLEKTD